MSAKLSVLQSLQFASCDCSDAKSETFIFTLLNHPEMHEHNSFKQREYVWRASCPWWPAWNLASGHV
jgi:hypothetical protein